jgi:hypothetical protein
MHSKWITCLAAAAVLVAFGTRSARADLIGLSSTNPAVVYRIDTATGAATPIVTLQGTGASFTGVDFMNGTLYGTDLYDPPFFVGSIDLTTGAVTYLSDQGGSYNWHGLAADDVNDVFYTIDYDDGFKLKSFGLSGPINTIGAGTGIDGRGMAYDPNTGILYATGSNSYGQQSLYSVDTSTGIASLIGAMGITNYFIGLAFDPASKVLYANTGSHGQPNVQPDDGKLFTVDVNSGLASLVGLNSATFQPKIDGLAWRGNDVRVPEPGVVALLSAAAIPALLFRRRRR